MKKKEFLSKYKKVIKKIDKKIDNVNRGGCGIYALELGKQYIDGEEIRESLTDVGLPMNEEFLNNLVDHKGYWNDTFDRKQRKKIEKILEKNLAV
jgi:hypothetical protein